MTNLRLTSWQQRRLQRQLHETRDARVYQRTLAVLECSRGRSVADVAHMLAVTRQSVYNWIDAYAPTHDPAALFEADRSGRPRLWTEDLQALLRTLLEHFPDQRGYYAVNWTVPLFQEELEHCTGQRLSEDTIRRELNRLGYVWKRSRYLLDPDPEREKKTAYSPTDSRVATLVSTHRLPGRG